MPTNATSAADDEWMGPTPAVEPPPHNLRIAFNNINGLGSQQYSHTIQHIADSQRSLEIDILGITEHCLNIGQPRVRNTIHTNLKKHFLGQYILQIDSAQMTTKTAYLPGGTATLLLGNIIGRLEPNGRGGDPLGRWSYITLRRKHRPPITIYTVYKVNARPTNAIGITAWHQQRLQLDSQSRSDEHPRNAFTTDLIKSVAVQQSLGHDIIIGGDFNDTLLSPNSQLLKLANQLQLTDPWTKLHPGHENFSTYHRGTKRIDSMICSFSVISTIRSISYSPYHWLSTSDHRTIVIDFDAKALLGDTTNLLPSPLLRGIKSNDRQLVATFIEKWHDHLHENNVFTRIRNLETHATAQQEAEALDAVIGQGGDSAEQQCRRKRSPLFTTRIAQLRALKSITHGNYLSLKQGYNHTELFQARISRHKIEFLLDTDLPSAYRQHKTIRNELRQVITAHRELRSKEQCIAIEKALESGKKDKAAIISNIKKQEARRHTWQTLRFVKQQQGTTQRVDRIDIPASWPEPNQSAQHPTTLEDPKSCHTWRTIKKPEDIEYYLQLRNREHFGQAQGTPFTESPLAEALNWQANTELDDKLLDGAIPTNISQFPQCQALLEACRAASDLDILPDIITFEDFKGKIKVWKENTSTSPSGRHLGRYKSLFTHGPHHIEADENPEEIPKQQLTDLQKDIATAIVALINFCIKTGYILERWKTIINTMIFKDPGNFKIHRLRVIHLYEADFNLLLAIKWRQLLHSANHRNLINPGLYGGRPGCEAQSLTLLEELKYDISYTTRRTLFNFDNDATSCYDRIIVSLASLINRKYGLHRKIVLIHAKTLQEARFHLRTSLGYSKNFYSHTIEFPIHGSGQGSGNSPSIWLLISSTLCDIHQQSSYGATFTSPDGDDKIKLTMVGFVDDCTGTCNDFRPQTQEDVPTLASRIQQDAQTWNDLLWSSGGKLELPKCSYHTLHFEFKPNGAPKAILPPTHTPIQIIDAETSECIEIPQKRADEPHKTLGHWKAPADDAQTKQLEALTSKSNIITALITTSQLTRTGTTLAYHGIYIPSLKYVLPQCFFDEKHLDRAERKSLPILIAKSGYNRTTAIGLRYAPLSHAGCGFVRWSTLQGEGQIQLFLKHWRTSTTISQTLRIAIAWSQWQSGLSKSLINDTKTPLPHLESRWIKSLRKFLRKINASIHLDNPRTVPPERTKDIFIMEHATRCKLYKDADLKILNYCRQYIHVTTVSELFDASGKKILPHMFNCTRPPWFNKLQFIILQRQPSQYQIKYQWQRFCRLLCTQSGSSAATLDLGTWTHQGLKLRSRRESYITPTGKIFHWIDDCYWLLEPHNETPHHLLPLKATSWTPTDTATPISVIPIQTLPSQPIYTTEHPNNTHAKAQPIPRQSTNCEFQEYLRRLPDWEQQLLTNVEFEYGAHSTMAYLHECLEEDQQIYEVSDGSMAQNTTSFGWTIGTKNGQRLVRGSGPGFGPATSHRAEGWGKLSAARFLFHLQIYAERDYPNGLQIVSISDNLGLITSLTKRREYPNPYPNATLQPDWDIIEEIHNTYLQLSNTSVQYGWVKAHQDNDTPYEQLSVKAQYNVDADHLATDYMEANPARRKISPLLPTARCILQIRNKTIHGHYTTAIREAASIPELFGYLRGKHRWTKQTLSNIQWKWLTLAANNYEHSDNHVMKLVYDQLPTPAYKSKNGGQPWLQINCRHCNQHPETFDHLLRCKQIPDQDFRSTLPVKVLTYCKQKKTPHNFHATIVIALEHWVRNIPPLESIHSSAAVHKLIHAQQKIGWTKFLRGFLSKQWQTYLEYEFNHNSDAPPPKTFDYDSFFSGLIKVMWRQQTNFWKEHQQHLHNPTHEQPHLKAEEYKLEVRNLHSLRDKVLAQHRDDYFPHNLSEFLHSSTPTQLYNYIINYKPAIRRSIAAARKLATNSKPIFHFPGFHRKQKTRAPPTTTTTTIEPTTNPSPSDDYPNPTQTQLTVPRIPLPHRIFAQTTLVGSAITNTLARYRKERPPHKHSRWKPTKAVQDIFKAFFNNKEQD